MSENDPFLLSEIQKELDSESSSVNHGNTGDQGFNEFEDAFLITSASGNKDVLDNTETYISSYGPVITAGQPTDLNLALENNTLLNKSETIARNPYNEKNHVTDKDPTDVNGEGREETENTRQISRTESNKTKLETPNETKSTHMIERVSSPAACNKSINEVSNIFIKIEEDITSSKETLGTIPATCMKLDVASSPRDEPSSKEVVRPSKFNCVMCDNHFVDLLQLESHVKSHNEVLHFSILLKKVGKENEERTRNVISSLIELARSSDINLNKFGSLFKNEGAARKKCNAGFVHDFTFESNIWIFPKEQSSFSKQRRKSRPRKKVEQMEDFDDCDDVWNETIDDEREDNERNDPTYATNQKDLEKNLTQRSDKRLRKRMKKEDEKINVDNADIEEQEVKDNGPEIEKLEEGPQTGCQEHWEAIAGSDFQIVKKDGPGRPAYGLNCPVCTKFITGRSRLRLHMKKEHGMFQSTAIRSGHKGNIKIHTCEVCGQKVKTLRKLKAHLLDKHKVTLSSNAKMYKCALCDAFFGRRSELKEHRTEAHPGQSEHICTSCGKMLMSASLLEKHMRNHTGEKPYQCHLCPKAFTINTKLQEHIRQHTGERPFVCEICGAKFNRSCNKKRHMLIHEGKYPHTCEICGKGFRDIGPLTLHIRRHTGDKPYKCEDANCNMAFITRGELECHRAKHTQKREHLCSLCGAEFLYKGDLRRHAKLHTGERPYKCSDCNAAFTRNQHLKHHWQSHHASGARVHKEWKPRKKPEQFGLPKQTSLLTSQPQSNILPMQVTSTLQQPSRFPQQQPSQPQQHVQQQHHQQQQPNNTCVVCNQWFPSESALKSHGVIHTMDSDHMFLNMTTACRQDYNPLSGVQLNNIPAPVPGALPGALEVCTICNILITEPGTLQIHLQNVHGQYS